MSHLIIDEILALPDAAIRSMYAEVVGKAHEHTKVAVLRFELCGMAGKEGVPAALELARMRWVVMTGVQEALGPKLAAKLYARFRAQNREWLPETRQDTWWFHRKLGLADLRYYMGLAREAFSLTAKWTPGDEFKQAYTRLAPEARDVVRAYLEEHVPEHLRGPADSPIEKHIWFDTHPDCVGFTELVKKHVQSYPLSEATVTQLRTLSLQRLSKLGLSYGLSRVTNSRPLEALTWVTLECRDNFQNAVELQWLRMRACVAWGQRTTMEREFAAPALRCCLKGLNVGFGVGSDDWPDHHALRKEELEQCLMILERKLPYVLDEKTKARISYLSTEQLWALLSCVGVFSQTTKSGAQHFIPELQALRFRDANEVITFERLVREAAKEKEDKEVPQKQGSRTERIVALLAGMTKVKAPMLFVMSALICGDASKRVAECAQELMRPGAVSDAQLSHLETVLNGASPVFAAVTNEAGVDSTVISTLYVLLGKGTPDAPSGSAVVGGTIALAWREATDEQRALAQSFIEQVAASNATTKKQEH